jgi:hypothetical protein
VLKTVLILLVLAGGALGTAVFLEGGPRHFFTGDPSRADYTWLRRELSHGEKAAEQMLRNGRRGGSLASAKALEQAILASRASALSTGTEPIPDTMRAQLEDYFPQDVLDKVRWAFPNNNWDLGSLVAWYKAEGGAVTLQDTIVYASRAGLESEYLWAHELTHVLQYEELGLEDFARIYATNPELLEKQARDNANQIVRDIRARRRADAVAANDIQATLSNPRP